MPGDDDMEETVTGIRFRGKWDEIADRGEEVSAALDDADAGEDDVTAWEAWRPRQGEDADSVRERTVAQASVGENAVEEAGNDAVDEAVEAADDVQQAVDDVSSGDVSAAGSDGLSAVVRVSRALRTAVRRVFRRLESSVYRHVQTRTNPLYFDGDIVSGELKRRRKPGEDGDEETYELSVEVRDEAVQERFREELETGE